MFPYAGFVIAFTIVTYLFETYLDIRQHIRFGVKKVPSALAPYIPEKDFISSQEYNHAKSQFSLVTDLFEFIIGVTVLWFEILPIFWGYSEQVLNYVGLSSDYQILQSLVFIFIYHYIHEIITLPFSLYSIFVIEQKFGFNKQTLGTFFLDHLKSTALLIVFGAPIVCGLIYIIEWGGDYFWLYVWLFLVVIMIIMLTIYPVVIAPLFNKFTELEVGELREKIENLAKQVQFPLTKLYKIDGSTRSSHSNAYFYGFYKNKRIVLYDTLMEHCDNDQIVAIVAHELGHYKLNHTLKNLIISLAHSLVFFYVFGFYMTNEELVSSFGFTSSATLIKLTLFSMLYGPVEFVIALLFHTLSRKFEYQADEFATKLNFDLTTALVAIHKENKSNLNPDPLYSLFHFSHPTLLERLAAIEATKKKLSNKRK